MGNHEYCTGCGMSSFHSGEPCEPIRVVLHELQMRKITSHDALFKLRGLLSATTALEAECEAHKTLLIQSAKRIRDLEAAASTKTETIDQALRRYFGDSLTEKITEFVVDALLAMQNRGL